MNLPSKSDLKKATLAYLLYNAMTWITITGIYTPYQLFVIGYSMGQLERWLLTSLAMSLLANLIIGPWTRYCWKKIDGWLGLKR